MTEHVLEEKMLFILDMDGTFYLGNKLIEGSLSFIEKLRETGRKFVFFTNNASRTPEFYISKLAAMGCKISRENILTSGDVTIHFLKENYSGKSVYLLGTPELKKSFAEAGIAVTEDNPGVVVASFDLTLTYDRVSKACSHIRKGVPFIATHMDLNCPTEYGFIPDCGSICAMLTASTGVKPRYLGKPFSETFDMIDRMTGYSKSQMAIVGDRLYTDIAAGVNNNVTAVLVLTGETRPEDLEKSDIKPDHIFDSLGDICRIL